MALFFLAALIVSAFAVPSASAWTKEGNPLEEAAELTLQGSWGFEYAASEFGSQCDDVTGALGLAVEGNAEISEMSFDECYGQGKLAGLTALVTPTNLPWPVAVDTNGEVIEASGTVPSVKLDYFSPSDPEHKVVLKTVYCTIEWQLRPDNSEAISALQNQGGGECEGAPGAQDAQFSVSPAGWYGF